MKQVIGNTGVKKIQALKLLFGGVLAAMMLCFGFLGSAQFSYAQIHLVPDYPCPDNGQSAKKEGRYDMGGFLVIVQNAVKMLFGISGSIALLVFIYGGFMWLFSGGEQQRVTAGTDALQASAVGLVILLGSWVLVNFIVITLVTQNTPSATAVLFRGAPWDAISAGCYNVGNKERKEKISAPTLIQCENARQAGVKNDGTLDYVYLDALCMAANYGECAFCEDVRARRSGPGTAAPAKEEEAPFQSVY